MTHPQKTALYLAIEALAIIVLWCFQFGVCTTPDDCLLLGINLSPVVLLAFTAFIALKIGAPDELKWVSRTILCLAITGPFLYYPLLSPPTHRLVEPDLYEPNLLFIFVPISHALLLLAASLTGFFAIWVHRRVRRSH